jgi:high frequency lysogenization protein
VNAYGRDRTLALAGVFQAACLVQQLARRGHSDRAALAASIGSVLAIDSATTEEVYGSTNGVGLGLRVLCDKLSGRAGTSDIELAHYVVSILQLERRLARDRTMLSTIRRGLEALATHALGRDVDDPDPEIRAKLAELYRLTLSTLTPRIMVSGEQGYLANAAIADNVRAALFAGVRSAFLWRQLGGKRWHLILRKLAIRRTATRLLQELHENPPRRR